ncbi:CTP-dependent riboflavin kinase, partial [Bacillus alveayuensis]|nr:CTP-dependent riboflavin kinase [Bacillus alveayuensis]
LRNNVRNFVEKYFFDTPETATTVDISTFIEGVMKGIGAGEVYLSINPHKYEYKAKK